MFMASKYDPHIDLVISLRREGSTWRVVAEEIGKQGTEADERTVRAWFLRRQKRAEKLAEEIEPFDKLQGGIRGRLVANEITEKSETTKQHKDSNQTEIPPEQYTKIECSKEPKKQVDEIAEILEDEKKTTPKFKKL